LGSIAPVRNVTVTYRLVRWGVRHKTVTGAGDGFGPAAAATRGRNQPGPVAGVRWLKSRSEEWRTSARLLQHSGPKIDRVMGKHNQIDCSGGPFVHPLDLNLT